MKGKYENYVIHQEFLIVILHNIVEVIRKDLVREGGHRGKVILSHMTGNLESHVIPEDIMRVLTGDFVSYDLR